MFTSKKKEIFKVQDIPRQLDLIKTFFEDTFYVTGTKAIVGKLTKNMTYKTKKMFSEEEVMKIY